jgi:hypothetical protein
VTAGTLFRDSTLRAPIRYLLCLLLLWISAVSQTSAGYKARPYVPLPMESYPAGLTSADNGNPMMFLEIDLKAAVSAGTKKQLAMGLTIQAMLRARCR